MSDKSDKMTVFLNPLLCISLDPTHQRDKTLNTDYILWDICGHHHKMEKLPQTLQKRYVEITEKEVYVPIVPAQKDIIDKLVYPIQRAKINLVAGDFLGCIALCGLASEMATIYIFDVIKTLIPLDKLDKKWRKALKGDSYEKWGQKCRLDFLKKHFKPDISPSLIKVNEIRKKYQHFFSLDHSDVEKDANEAYLAAQKVFSLFWKFDIKDGKVIAPEFMKEYLKKKTAVI